MKKETLEKANKIQSKIEFLENKIKTFDPKSKWVYLSVGDHYGNKYYTIETYHLGCEYYEAAGYMFEDFISDSYAEFLTKVRDKMQEKIDLLKQELDELQDDTVKL